MDNLHGIYVFLRVVEAGSLSSAARSLGVSTSAVSATIARLEDRLSARLLNRTTRRLRVTEEGEGFYGRCKQIVADLEAAELMVGRAGREPSGRLRVGIPSTLGRLLIVPNLPVFIKKYPSISLEVVCTDFVPHTLDAGLNLSVQIGKLHDSSLGVRQLGCSKYVICASPDYLDAHGVPQKPSELSKYACLNYRQPRNGRLWDWRFLERAKVQRKSIAGLITFNSHDALVAAATAGLGIIQVADYYAHAALQNGELVEILTEYKTEGHIISAVFPKPKTFAPKVRVFIDFLLSLFATQNWDLNSTRASENTLVLSESTEKKSKVKRKAMKTV